MIDEVTAHGHELILFIDELHTVVGAGAAEGSMDASNMLKPALARGELHVIGATTIDEYRKNIEKDAALERRFQPVLIDEPTVDETIEILDGPARPVRGVPPRAHQRRGDRGSRRAVRPVHRDRFLPDKAIDLIDQAAARVRLRTKTKPPDHRALDERAGGARAREGPGGRRGGLRARERAEGPRRGGARSPRRERRQRPRPRAGGDARGHRRGGLAADRHPRLAAHAGGARAAAASSRGGCTSG